MFKEFTKEKPTLNTFIVLQELSSKMFYGARLINYCGRECLQLYDNGVSYDIEYEIYNYTWRYL